MQASYKGAVHGSDVCEDILKKLCTCLMCLLEYNTKIPDKGEGAKIGLNYTYRPGS